MKLRKMLIVIFILHILVSCSSKSNNDNQEDQSAAVEQATEALESDDLNIENSETESDVATPPPVTESDSARFDTMPETKNVIVNDIGEYTVVVGDTLMLIAFKLYGDYSKWKDIQRINNLNSNNLIKGSKIRYEIPPSAFVWHPEGDPHLILRDETLGTISEKYYNTKANWKKLWENNRPMIKDPNLIFAGFTLYYQSPGKLASN